MGNTATGSSSGSAPGGTTGDVTKAYTPAVANPHSVLNRENNLTMCGSGFTVCEGVRKRDGAPVTIFRYEKTNNKNGDINNAALLAANALRHCKRLRHPSLLTFLDGVETSEDIFLVTELGVPLSLHLRTLGGEGLEDGALEWGLRCVAAGLAFLNEEISIVHGNVTTDSIFVTASGDWKLFGFELVDSETKNEPSQLARQCAFVPDRVLFRSPERRMGKSFAGAPCWAYDSWGLGCVACEVYSTLAALRARQSVPSSVYSRQDPDLSAVQNPSLRASLQQLLSQSPSDRLAPSLFLKHDIFSHPLVRTLNFASEIMIKTFDKKEAFFRSLPDRLSGFPKATLRYKLLPVVAQVVEMDTKAINAFAASSAAAPAPGSNALMQQPPQTNLLALIDVLLAMDAALAAAEASSSPGLYEGFKTEGETCWLTLFTCSDRNVRICLLQRFDRIAPLLSSPAVNSPGFFDAFCTGFIDVLPIVRELTIKAALSLVSKLDATNRNDKLLRYLAKLQGDAENAIRTNAVICLTLMSGQLTSESRRRVLAASYIRALKDPFIHARIAGLRGLATTHATFLDNETLACRILPSVCPLLADPAKEVSTVAFETVEAILATLRLGPERKIVEDAGGTSSAAYSVAAGGAGALGDIAAGGMGLFGKAIGWATGSSSAAPTSASAPTSGGGRPASTSSQPPQPPSTSQSHVPPPVKPKAIAKQSKPGRVKDEWEDDDDDEGDGKDEDPDDFFTKAPPPRSLANNSAAKKPVAANNPSLNMSSISGTSNGGNNTLVNLNYTSTPSPVGTSSLDYSRNVAKPAPVLRPPPASSTGSKKTDGFVDLLSDPLPSVASSAPVPALSMKKSGPPPKGDDFFEALMMQPPKPNKYGKA